MAFEKTHQLTMTTTEWEFLRSYQYILDIEMLRRVQNRHQSCIVEESVTETSADQLPPPEVPQQQPQSSSAISSIVKPKRTIIRKSTNNAAPKKRKQQEDTEVIGTDPMFSKFRNVPEFAPYDIIDALSSNFPFFAEESQQQQ